ncbi:MAG: hypothetical protein JWL86_621 [Rhizobium sp.]|nr:hypothetical protein [Rhizobium sp.]
MNATAPDDDADREHKRDVNSKALAALVEAGVPMEHGIRAITARAITAIVRGHVPAVAISY